MTMLHTMLAKLFPTVFNESQMLSDKAMNWPSKICQDCKGKVIESYRLYELCTKSVRQLTILTANQQTQDENDDPLAQIKMEFVECEELTELKKEYDPDDQISECRGFGSVSPTEDVFKNDEESCSSTANEPQLKPSISFCEGLDHNYSALTRIRVPVRQPPALATVPTSSDQVSQLPTLPQLPIPVPNTTIIYSIPERLSKQVTKSSVLPSLPYRSVKPSPALVDRPVAFDTTPASTSCAPTSAHIPVSKFPFQSYEERIEKYMQVLTKIARNLQGSVNHIFKTLCQREGTVTREFEFEKVSSKEELESFNSKLENDPIFMAKMLSHIIYAIYTVSSIDDRLSTILNLLFDKQFLRQCSWTGRGFPNPKICLSDQEHILSLCKFAGGNNFMELTDEYVKSFFLKKLYHSSHPQNTSNCVPKKRPCPD
ncbi:uncharacterized protein LOC131259547 [Anopheles coustani]|uniref:uncharacterized protein LOC131259547 n=1 Tax=Anopheles coustani TaxID=139045 RepID=UPI00265AA997|nr:uncharacterized protein LOC131259547 [Anopheles coustani]